MPLSDFLILLYRSLSTRPLKSALVAVEANRNRARALMICIVRAVLMAMLKLGLIYIGVEMRVDLWMYILP
jgi:hypothetical protein